MNKICTTIEQSKKLMELGIDINNADMHWMNEILFLSFDKVDKVFNDKMGCEYLPAWSLTALLNIIPLSVLDKFFNEETKSIQWNCMSFPDKHSSVETNNYDNPIDACVEMIVKLKELDLL